MHFLALDVDCPVLSLSRVVRGTRVGGIGRGECFYDVSAFIVELLVVLEFTRESLFL